MNLGIRWASHEQNFDIPQGDNKVLNFVDNLLDDAFKSFASDIHIEPESDRVTIRYSIDGVLRYVCDFGISNWPQVCARIKILAGLDLAETQSPQCGNIPGSMCDFRTSSHPTIHGENLVLRLLNKKCHQEGLELGFDPHLWKAIVKETQRTSGLILVTGPTCSGKTTTIHALLAKIHKEGKRVVMSIEDPVEMRVPGIRQTSVRYDNEFEETINSGLRQNPGVIFLGEIRTPSVAKLAMRATMTGRLVFSTLHTTSAIDTLKRLEDLGINLKELQQNITIVSQRLVRKLCCGNCPLCSKNGGYRGRTVVAEIINPKMLPKDIDDNTEIKRMLRGTYKSRFIEDLVEDMVAVGVTSSEEAILVV